MKININNFLEKFNEEYKFLYENNNQVAGYNEAVNAFDDFCKTHSDFVSEFIKFRGDFISSDREAAAFMFSLVDSVAKQNLHTFFILNVDAAYNNKPEYIFEVESFVYLIPLEKQDEVKKLAARTHNLFHGAFNVLSATDIFEDFLKIKGIKYQYVGKIKFPFQGRKINYLPDYLPQAII